MFGFLPAYPDSSGVSAPIGESEIREREIESVGGGAPTLPFFHSSCSREAFLQLAGKGFDVRAPDRRAQKAGEFCRIADELDLFAKPFRNCPETDL